MSTAYKPAAYCPETERDILECGACMMGVCSWCGHEHDDPAHGPEPEHGENSPCYGCPDCDDEDDDL